MTMRRKPFEYIREKGENAGNQYFFLYPQCFLPFATNVEFFNYAYFVVCKIKGLDLKFEF